MSVAFRDATRRAQLESVRAARAAGCGLLQLTMNKSRTRTARFYEQLGFTPSHIGYKRDVLQGERDA